jgi:hypothetical protein
MNSEKRFPEKLLAAPIKERISYFENFTLAHPHLMRAAERLTTSLNEPAGSAIIFLFGPTGVGKTTLLKRTIQRLREQFLVEYEEDKSRLLFAGFEAPAPELQNFSWKSFYVRALEALHNPLVDYNDHLIARTYGQTTTKDMLRRQLEGDLQHRSPKIFFVDEAQNLGKVASAKHYKEQADCIKSLSNLSGVPILLIGTYELLDLRNQSAQLCRRSTDIHFPRYQITCSKDKKYFKSIVNEFQKQLPLEEEVDLNGNLEFCYERSLGCVGILKDWLTRALAGTLVNKNNTKTMEMEDLKKYAYSIDVCSTMLREIREEEKKLEQTITRNELRLELGLDPIVDAKLKPKEQSQKKEASKPRRVGETKPQRREVGDTKDVG